MSAASAGNEVTKTLLFVGAAVASLGIAFATRPPKVSDTMDDEVGKVLFEALSDPSAANGLEVLSYNEELGELRQFEVRQADEGIWVIPSHQRYPADAQERLVNAATMFTDLSVVRVVSEKEAEHETFGVLEPNANETRVGDEGVGTLVNVFGKGADGQTKLAALVIGKEVKGLDGQHYVRRPGKARVYQVKIDPTQLSTKFEDWIETDLLKLSSWDVASITMKDYSMQSQRTFQGYQVAEEKRFDLKVTDDNGTWNLDYLKEYNANNEPTLAQLEEGEELKKDRLDTLKNSLSELKIVDVERKPKGLGADLRADKSFAEDMESVQSLAERGFFALQGPDGGIELKCGDGELIVDTKDGVEYTLRFGKIAGLSEEASTDTDEGEATESSVNRYMFVSVRVNEEHFPAPELEPLPEAAEATVDAKSESEGDETNTADDAESDESAADATDEEAADAGKDDESADSAGGEEDGDDKSVDNELALEIERIKKANQRKIDERNDKIAAANKKVSELTYRFADWYYIVSDDVFKKLRLRRDDVIAFSEEAKKAGTGIGAFRSLQAEGLKPAE